LIFELGYCSKEVPIRQILVLPLVPFVLFVSFVVKSRC